VAHAASTPAAPASAIATSSLRLPILLGLLTSVLLDFCFPVAGPPRAWQPFLAWIALVPLLYALLNERAAAHPRYLRRAALTAYLSGVLWYILNCYWIYQTMLLYGVNFPPIAAAGILVLFSAILGLYFGLFGLLLALFRRRFSLAAALLLAPFLWTAIELAAARITSVPWDQLGYSQVDMLWLTRLAPWAGVYGITFILVAVNALLFADWTPVPNRSSAWRRFGIRIAIVAVLIAVSRIGEPPPSPTSAYAVLLQPNIQVSANSGWTGDEWHGDLAWILDQDALTCTTAYTGLPRPGVSLTTPASCAQNTPPPGIILWPESESWLESDEPRTLQAMHILSAAAHAPLIFGMAGPNQDTNSALFVRADGTVAGRYDKMHLVPFGEYVPYEKLFFFAKTLTHQLSHLQPGTQRIVFKTDGHPFGVFICYESIFADEIRHFALNGAQVLVNLSDDGWYGDTSAPWQHLEMTRMRAAENRRWLLLDTDNGVTTVIDPYGRVTLSAPRHTLTSLVARYGYRSDLTFYTRHGDVFAYLCCAVVLVALIAAIRRSVPAAS
jgi:apolipoprotein N-acyltransferase